MRPACGMLNRKPVNQMGSCRGEPDAYVTTGSRAGDRCRNFSMTLGTTSMARSISASALNRPKEKRRLRRAPSPLGFIARNTCEASCEPVRQAEPAEQQMPCRSNRRRAAGDSMSSNEKLDVFGSRAAPAPLTDAPLTTLSTDFSNRSRRERMLHCPSARYLRASSAAFPSPTIDATFSVQPRRPFSWPPPAINGLKRVRRLT